MFFPGADVDSSIFARLLWEDTLADYAPAVPTIIDKYRPGRTASIALDNAVAEITLVTAELWERMQKAKNTR